MIPPSRRLTSLSVAEAKKASYAVQELFKQLVGSDHLQRGPAVELLNDHLGSAIRTLFGMGGSRLFDVMLSVRKQLLLDGSSTCS